MKSYPTIAPQRLQLEGLDLVGVSTAGVGTSITIPQLKVCFDTAQGLPHAFPMKHYLITHAHMDHAGGIPYILSQKAMTSQSPGQFYMPPSMVAPMTQILELWSNMEDYECPFEFCAVKEDIEYPISGDYFFKIFPTHHRIPSNGYTIFKRHKKLKEGYKNRSREEIIALKQSGQEIHDTRSLAKVSFTGDSKIEFLDTCSWIKTSEILIMEVTFAGDNRSIEHARKWGHIHLDELLPHLESLQCKHLVLIHPSGRYSPTAFRKIIQETVPPPYQEKIILFPRGL